MSPTNNTRLQFQPAVREHAKARIALIGPAGAGKSLSALKIASALGQRIAVICAERGSALKHAGKGIAFDMLPLGSFSPALYCEAIEAAAAAGYDVLIIDGLSQAWAGRGGALEQVDQIAKRSQSQNSFFAWREVTPEHNRLVDTMLSCPMHLIATLRVKTEYVVDDVQRDGKSQKVPRKIGLAPIQREGLDYEFDVVGDITVDHDWIISKDRTELFDRAVIHKPGVEFGQQLLGWLNAGEAPRPRLVVTEAPAQPQPRPRHAADARRAPAAPAQPAPAQPAPAAPDAPAQPAPRPQSEQPLQPVAEPCFSKSGDWSGAAEWASKPLSSAPLNVLRTYSSILVLALDNPKNRSRLEVLRAHRKDVLAAIGARVKPEAAATAQPDHTTSEGSGWDLSARGANHDDDTTH
jgi:hypothetical protein